MKRRELALLLLACAAGLALWVLRPRAAAPGPQEERASLPAPGAPQAPQQVVRTPSVPAGETPPVEQASNERDGFIEARVTALGAPVAAADVRLYWRGAADPNTGRIDWRFAGGARTGAAGVARIPARPGAYLLAARAPGYAAAHLELLRPSGETVTRATLAIEAGVALAGVVVQRGSGEAVPLAQLTFAPASRRRAWSEEGDAPAEELARAAADRTGRFRVDGLAPGLYLAAVQAAGFASVTQQVRAPGAEMRFELAAASFLEGHVVGADGRGAAGAEVIALAEGRDQVTATTSGSGGFSLEVKPGHYTLVARRGAEAGAGAAVDVAAGATVGGLRVVLGAGGVISGAVVNAVSQQGVPFASVLVSPHDANGDTARASSDANGAYSVNGLPPGSYDVVVSAARFEPVSRRGVTVQAGQTFPLRVELHPQGAVAGTVSDPAGHGVANALVRELMNGPFGAAAAETRTDASGAYRLEGLQPGHVRLLAQREGAAAGAIASVDVPEGGTGRLDLQLAATGQVTGHVRREDGSPAPAGTTVRFSLADAPGFGVASVDEEGAYLTTLPAGTYRANLGGGAFRAQRYVTVEAGNTAQLDLPFADAPEPSTGLEIAVLEPDGIPSPGATLRVLTSEGGGMVAFTDGAGKYDVPQRREDLPDRFLVLAANGGRSGRAQVATGQKAVTVQLQPGATLRGHLTAPADSFTVRLTASPDQGLVLIMPVTLSFTGDTFVVPDAPAARLQVAVQTDDGRIGAGEVTLAPGGSAAIEIALEQEAGISGRMVDGETQQPVADVVVRVNGGRGVATTGSDGRFLVKSAAGEQRLAAWVSGAAYQPLVRDVTVQTGQTLALGDLLLQREKAMAGTVGMWLRGDSEQPPTVESLISDGPAQRAGVRLGDVLVAVDGARVNGTADANVRLRGAPGTPVQLTLLRGGVQLAVVVTRAS